MLALATLAAGCASTRPEGAAPVCVAVLPFENLSADDNGGRIVTRMCQSALSTREGVRVADAGLVEEALLRQRIRVPTLLTARQRDSLHAALDCQYILFGSVVAFGFANHPYAGKVGIVSFATQLVQLADGQIVWAKTYSRQGSDGQTFFGYGTKHDPGVLAAEMGRQVAGDIPWQKLP